MGKEFRAKGVNVVLGPVVGPLGKIASGGRNWEGFSNDPYLAGALVAETIHGLQSSSVVACTKVRKYFKHKQMWLTELCSISLGTSRRLIATLLWQTDQQRLSPGRQRLQPYLPTLMIEPCMSYTCGHLLMPSGRALAQ